MLNYRYSKYNIVQRDIEDRNVLYNCISNAYCIVRSNEDFQQILNGKKVDSFLISNGFLVEDGVNENALAEYYLNQKKNPEFLNLFIVPTRFCNFDCIYCYEEHKPLYMSLETQNNIIKFIKNNLPKHKGLIITWFGGEPTVALNVVEYLSKEIKQLCNELKKPYYAAINTNGYELTSEVMERLLSYNIRYFQICIDGIQRTHDKHRIHINRNDSFDKILNNLGSFRS